MGPVSPRLDALDEDAPISLPCSVCGHKTSKTVGWLKTYPDSLVCGGCGAKVALDPDTVRQTLKELAGVVDSFFDAFRDALKGFNEG